MDSDLRERLGAAVNAMEDRKRRMGRRYFM